jgi:hypothetical protein
MSVRDVETRTAAGAARDCPLCRRLFVVSAAELAFLARVALKERWPGLRLPRFCTECRAYRRQEKYAAVDDGRDEQRTCVVCGAGFVFTANEKAFYQARGFLRRRRCEHCRRQPRTGRTPTACA